ncbi:MAG: Fic family protein [Spirochaetes bacterium]|nr:Fic family protein [Spirochaetota bacterium]
MYPIQEDIDAVAAVTRSIEGKKRALERLRPLSNTTVRRLEADFNLEMTFNSNAIEGNTLTLQETDLVLHRGLTIGNKTLREHFEATNHEKAITFIRSCIRKKIKFSKELILDLHAVIMKDIDAQSGLFRRTQLRILGATHIPPNFVKVESLIDALCQWYYDNERKMPAWLLAAAVHFQIAHIHPFADGNGRTARLMMNLILLGKGYPPAVILHVDRKKYYRTLQEADAGKWRAYHTFIGKAVERSLVIWLSACTTGARTEKLGFMTLSEASRHCDYSFEYLSLLARKGRIPAIKLRRNWVITREALDEYLQEIEKRRKKK